MRKSIVFQIFLEISGPTFLNHSFGWHIRCKKGGLKRVLNHFFTTLIYIYIYPDGFALDPTQNACFSVNRHACHCFVLCFNLFFLTVWKRPFRAPFFKLKRGTYHFLPRLPMFCTMFQLLCLTKNARFLECKKGFVTMFVVGVL